MKYMTFNSSCSYAGLANLLEFRGIDATDREIALEMNLPYLFARQEGGYCAGPMLQGAAWFDLYLRPLGLRFDEATLDREAVCPYLRTREAVMLGLRVSPERKHAVVYTGVEDEKYRFLNNKREHSEEPDTLLFEERELLAALDQTVTVGSLRAAESAPVDSAPLMERSIHVLGDLREDIHAFCAVERTPGEQRAAMDKLFRALLLDGVTMLELLGKPDPWEALKAAQAQLLAMVRKNRPAVPGRCLDLALLDGAMEEYRKLICAHLRAGSERT